MSLGTKTTALLAAIISTVLVGASLFLLYYQGESLKQSIFEGLDGQARMAAHGINSFIQEGLQEANAISVTLPAEALSQGRLSVVESHIKRMVKAFPKFQSGIFVLDRAGRFLVDYPPHRELRGKSFAFREYYRRTIRDNRGILGLPYKSMRTGLPVLTFTAPVRDAHGQLVAIVACSVNLLSQSALGGYRKQRFGETGYLYVFDAARRLVLHPTDARLLTNVEAGKNRLLEAALAGFEGVGSTINSQGVPMLMAVRKVHSMGWIVAVQVPEREAYAPLVTTRQRIVLVSGLAVLAALVIGAVAIRQVSRPLRQLERAASEIGKNLEKAEQGGSWDLVQAHSALERLKKIRSRDEIGLLASSFLYLATRLNLYITERNTTEEKIRQLMEHLVVPAFVLDDQGRVVIWNKACERLTGVPAAEVLDTRDHWRGFYATPRFCLADILALRRAEELPDLYPAHTVHNDSSLGLRAEIWCVMPRVNKRLYLVVDAGPIYDGDGKLIAVIETLRDVTEQKLAQAALQRLAIKDGLTGIANRRSFDETFEAEWLRAQREQLSLSLLIADIDYFKRYNDAYGHLKGDECLKRVAATIDDQSHRPQDLTARYGGEEFAIILPNTDRNGAGPVAERVREAVCALEIPHADSDVGQSVTLSIGVASMIPRVGLGPETLIAAADRALYAAKRGGRNRIVSAGVGVADEKSVLVSVDGDGDGEPAEIVLAPTTS